MVEAKLKLQIYYENNGANLKQVKPVITFHISKEHPLANIFLKNGFLLVKSVQIWFNVPIMMTPQMRKLSENTPFIFWVIEESVCVCEREKERERERDMKIVQD